VIHEHGDRDNERLIARARAALSDGGRILILDDIHEPKRFGVLDYMSSCYSLMFYHLVGGRTYAFEEIRTWLVAAGLPNVRRTNVGASGLTLVTGRP
jgi:hypothetical protein